MLKQLVDFKETIIEIMNDIKLSNDTKLARIEYLIWEDAEKLKINNEYFNFNVELLDAKNKFIPSSEEILMKHNPKK